MTSPSEIKTGHAGESGHWYTKDGDPAYEVPNKSKPGTYRNTTLRDAKKLGLVPSVTTILKSAAAPGLERWKIEQAYMAMATLPEIDGESIDDRIRRAKEDAGKQAKEAAERGTAIHKAIELDYLGENHDPRYDQHVGGVWAALNERYGNLEWKPEDSFCHPAGYGGKVDLHALFPRSHEYEGIVLDFKTKEFGPDDKVKAYSNHALQLAAYAEGLSYNEPLLVNVFVSVTHPGLVQIYEHPPGDYLDRFFLLLEYWQRDNGMYEQSRKAA